MVMPAPPREPGWKPNPSGLLAILLVVGVVVGVWFVSGGDPGTPTGSGSPPGFASTADDVDGGPDGGAASVPQSGQVDPETGLTWVSLDELPPEALDTVELIADGGPYPEDEDGGTFYNREGILPDRQDGYYTEYTVPTPGSSDRGARRVVAGEPDELFWTADHYDSFERIIS